MAKVKVKLVSIDDVKDFVKKANDFPYDIDVSLGKYIVDAKSIMGIFSLDLSRELEVIVNSDSSDFIESIANYTVE